jgi:hypothetical protein
MNAVAQSTKYIRNAPLVERPAAPHSAILTTICHRAISGFHTARYLQLCNQPCTPTTHSTLHATPRTLVVVPPYLKIKSTLTSLYSLDFYLSH